MSTRIAHFSDLHVTAPPGVLPWRSRFSKRLSGYLNLRLGRYRRFQDVVPVTRALIEDLSVITPDLTVFSGDVTTLSTAREWDEAEELLTPLRERTDVMGIPGNHDLYARGDLERRAFQRRFSTFLRSDLPDLAAIHEPYPVVRLVGEDVAVLGVQSALPRPLWDSSGQLGVKRLAALARALADPRIAARPTKIVVVHYAPRRHDGTPDTVRHGLRDAEALLALAAEAGVAAILHGHLHRMFCHPAGPIAPVALLGAGSLTDAKHARGYHVYDFDRGELRVTPRCYDPSLGCFAAGEPIDVALPGGARRG